MMRVPSLDPRRPRAASRRGLTLAEAMIAIAIGAVLSVIAYSLLEQIRGATSRLDYRIALIGDTEEAALALERQLDHMLPLGWPAIDFSIERWERDRIRFFSACELDGGGSLALVEIRMEARDPADRRPRAVGTADAAIGTDRLVMEFFTVTGEATGRTDTLISFRREGVPTLTFDASLDAPDARREPGSATVLRLVRPASVTAEFETSPADPDMATQVYPVVSRHTWSLTRKGGGA
jgi:prepilin-type N-terminal cleavage/methylation domain-containing protein